MRLGAVSAVVLVALAVLGAVSRPAPAPAPQILACGQIRCQSNADCPASCGPCVTWSGTCALFGPR